MNAHDAQLFWMLLIWLIATVIIFFTLAIVVLCMIGAAIPTWVRCMQADTKWLEHDCGQGDEWKNE